MEEVVEVVADVEQGCLQPQSTNYDIGKDFEQDSIEAARKIREHQGDHEAEVSCRGETDLHNHYKRCKKNPGHIQFIPVGDFKIEHLPSGYRDDVILDWIRAEADLTCRLSVKYTSESRPEFYPGTQDPYPFYQDGGNWLRTGTGSVRSAQRYTEKDNKNCECRECSGPGTHTPQKSWGEVTIVTACHVVFACDEARHTMCRFFYDRSTSYVSDFPTLTGLRVEYSDIEGDMCVMTCVTHDMDLVDKLVKICDRRLELFDKVRSKYWPNQLMSMLDPAGVSYVTDPTPGSVIVISHPHGCSKQISVGEWTHRKTEEETDSYKENTDVFSKCINSSYRYNAATCPGSSGAPVIRLLEKGKVGGVVVVTVLSSSQWRWCRER